MTGGCTEDELIYGESKILEGLTVSLYTHPEPDAVKIKSEGDCFSGGDIRYFNLGTTHTIECADPLDGKWEVNYYRYIAEDIIRVIVCFIPTSEPEPEPEPEEGDLTDYERICDGTGDIVDAAVNTVGGCIATVAGGVSDLHDDVTTELASLTTGITDLSNAVSEWIGDLQTTLTAQIAGVTESITGGFEGLSDKIDGLAFPTIDSIKGAFLDICADLAVALWDAILNKIEERYPKDEEESD